LPQSFATKQKQFKANCRHEVETHRSSHGVHPTNFVGFVKIDFNILFLKDNDVLFSSFINTLFIPLHHQFL
jgi:hypothetical protein